MCEFLARESVNSSPILALQWWRHFRLSLSLSLSLSVSLSLSHRKYLTHNIGSASALPIIGVPYRPTDDEVVHSKRLGNKVLVDLYQSNPIMIWDALVGQKFKRFQSWECRIKSFFKNFIDKNNITQFMLTCRKRSHSSTRTTCWRLKTLKHSINRCVEKTENQRKRDCLHMHLLSPRRLRRDGRQTWKCQCEISHLKHTHNIAHIYLRVWSLSKNLYVSFGVCYLVSTFQKLRPACCFVIRTDPCDRTAQKLCTITSSSRTAWGRRKKKSESTRTTPSTLQTNWWRRPFPSWGNWEFDQIASTGGWTLRDWTTV